MTTLPAEEVGTKVLFENERVRVWDLALAPGESLAKHIHRTDYFFIVESGGLIRFADPDNPADYHDVQFKDGPGHVRGSTGGQGRQPAHQHRRKASPQLRDRTTSGRPRPDPQRLWMDHHDHVAPPREGIEVGGR